MTVLRRALRKYILDPIVAVKDTTQAIISFTADQMHPLPVVFSVTDVFIAPLSVDHALRYSSAAKVTARFNLNVGSVSAAQFANSVQSAASLKTEQRLALTFTHTADTAAMLTQEANLAYASTVDTALSGFLATENTLTSVLDASTTLSPDLTTDAALSYRTRISVQSNYRLAQEQAGALIFTVTASSHYGPVFDQILSSRQGATVKSVYQFEDDGRLVYASRVMVQFRPNLTAPQELQTRFIVRGADAVNLISAAPLTKKSTVKSRLQATPTVGQSLSAKFTAKETIAYKLRSDVVLRRVFSVVSRFSVPLAQEQALREIYAVSASLRTPLRSEAALRSPFRVTARMVANLQGSAPLTARFVVPVTLKTNLIQDGFLRERFVGKAGIFANLALSQALKTTVTGKAILYPFVRQEQILRGKLTVAMQMVPALRQEHILKNTLKATVVFKTPLRQEQVCRAPFSVVSTLTPTLFVPYCAEAIALFARMSPQLTYTQRVAVNAYIVALKAAGVWTLLDYLYIFAVNNTTNANLNWVSDTKYPAVPTNSPTFTAGKGYTFGGVLTASGLNTGLNPSTGTHLFSQNSAHLYVRTLSNLAVLNASDEGNSNSYINSMVSLNLAAMALNSPTGVNISTTAAGAGAFAVNRNNAASFDGYTTKTGPITTISQSTTPANANLMIGGGLSVISNRQIGAASAGAGLTVAQMQTLITQTETLLTALGAI